MKRIRPISDEALNILAGFSLSLAMFVSFVLPAILQAKTEEDIPPEARIELPELSADIPDVSYAIFAKTKDDAKSRIDEAAAIINMALSIKPPRKFEPYKLVYVGNFYLTMYAATVEQCGNTLGITASGRKCTEDPTCWTVAVDPKIIPLGTYLKIDLEGYEDIIFRADDTGGDIKNYWIDIYTDSEPLSKSFNPTYADVWIVDYV